MQVMMRMRIRREKEESKLNAIAFVVVITSACCGERFESGNASTVKYLLNLFTKHSNVN